MKNIFKFMGIALMACSLTLVACSKDEDENTTNPQNPENPENPTQSSYTLTWDGQTPELGYINAITNGQVFLFNAAKSYSNEGMELPAFQLYLINGAAEGATPTVENFGLSAYFEQARSSYPSYVYDSQVLQGSNGQMGDYQLYDIENEVIGAIDITSYTVNVKYDMTFFSFLDVMDSYAHAAGDNDEYEPTQTEYSEWLAAATHKVLNWELVNYKFTAAN